MVSVLLSDVFYIKDGDSREKIFNLEHRRWYQVRFCLKSAINNGRM